MFNTFNNTLVLGRDAVSTRRDRRGETANRLCSAYTDKKGMAKFNEDLKRVGFKGNPFTSLNAWVSWEFFDELVVPFIGDSIPVMDALRGVRVHPKFYDMTPVAVLKLLSHIIVRRLTHIDKHPGSQLHIIPGDITSLLSKADY